MAGERQRGVAIVGVGYSPLSRCSGRSVLDLAAEAARGAIADAGLTPGDVDGVGSFMVLNDSVSCEALATALALPGLRWIFDFQMGGQSPCFVTWQAANAVEQGHADAVLVFRALNGRSGLRVGSGTMQTPAVQYRAPIGYTAYLMNIAMWAQRYLYEVGGDQRDLGAVAVAQRAHAVLNERAVLRKPLDLDGYLASPYVAEPFRVLDCTVEIDGACAIVVTSLDRARDLPQPPVVVRSGAYRSSARPGLDISDQLLVDDYTRNFTTLLRDELFGRAGLVPADVDVAEIYDCFTSVVLMGLEGLGLCERGGAGEFIRSGQTALDGRLPTNTNGGLLSEGYLHGMNTVTEAVLQVRGQAGPRQAPRHDVAVVTSGGLNNGSALLLTADR
jgi:acetyl-CoA acetyltransferase